MRRLLANIDAADIDYWLTIALAVVFVWRAGQVDDRAAMFILFGAAYLIIHAHGRRILAATKDTHPEGESWPPDASRPTP